MLALPSFEDAKKIVKELWNELDDNVGAASQEKVGLAFIVIMEKDEGEWLRTRKKLKNREVPLKELDAYIKKLKERVAEEAKKDADGDDSATFLQRLVDNRLLLPEYVKVPLAYFVVPSGIYLVKPGEEDRPPKIEKICHTPLWISARTENLDSGNVGLEITYIDTEKSAPRILTRSLRELLDSNELIKLADKGIVITSNSSKKCVEYLAATFSASKNSLPTNGVVEKSGWVTYQNKKHFVMGSSVFAPGLDRRTNLTFEARNDTAQAIIESTTPKGTLEDWTRAMRPLMEYRVFALFVGASFAAPLVEIFRLNNVILHLQGESTTGKTSVLMAATSVYGFPAESMRNNSMIRQWRGTDNAIEFIAFSYNGLPLALDEASQADPFARSRMIYMLGNGAVKNRARPDGEAQKQKTFSLIVLSTGEISLISERATTGQEVRFMEVSIPPFAEDESDKREMVNQFRQTIEQNYGHAGRVYLQLLVDIVNDEKKLSGLEKTFNEKYRELIKHQTSVFHARNAQHIALIGVAIELANNAFQLFSDKEKVWQMVLKLYAELGEKWNAQITTSDKILRYLWDYIEAEELNFDSQAVHRLGFKCETHGYQEAFAFFEGKLDEALVKGGFDPKSAKRALKENNFVILDGEGQLAQVIFEDKKRRRYIFHRDLLKGMELFQDLTKEEKEQIREQKEQFADLS